MRYSDPLTGQIVDRRSLAPGAFVDGVWVPNDLRGESLAVKEAAQAHWTEEVVTRWKSTFPWRPPPQPLTPAELDALDTASLNAILLQPGSIDRAELKTLFNHENRIRGLENKAAITLAQFVTAVKALMRNGA